MPDIFDEIAGNIGNSAGDGLSVSVAPFNAPAAPDIFDEIAASVGSAPAPLLGQNATPLQAAARVGVGGLTRFLPFGDEIVAGGTSAIDAMFRGADLSTAYDYRLNEVRNYQKAFAEQPGGSIAAPVVDIAGAVAIPLKSKIAELAGKERYIQAAKEAATIGGILDFSEGSGGFVNRATDAAKGALASSIFSPIAVAGGDVIGSIFSKASKALNRKSIGANYVDYLKSADDLQTIDLPEGDISSLAKNSFDDLLSRGELGASRDPGKLAAVATGKQVDLATKINTLIQNYDEAVSVPVRPQFNKALDYIAEGKVPADQVDRYINRLAELENGIKVNGKGSLSYLQQQKIAIGSSYKPDDGVLNGFNRALYEDIQKTIEKVVPDVAPLNRELQKWKIVAPALKRGLARAESSDPINKAVGLWRTTGGFGVPIMLANSAAGPIGAAGALATSLLTTAKGQQALSAATGATAKIADLPLSRMAAGAVSSGTTQDPLQSFLDSGSSQQDIRSSLLQSSGATPSPTAAPNNLQTGQEAPKSTAKQSYPVVPRSSANRTTSPVDNLASDLFSKPAVTKKDIKAVESLIDSDAYDAAVYEAESSRNPSAKNKDSTAAGGFQLVKKTAKKLGVTDPYDLAQNYQGFLKLKQENVKRFGDDPKMLYAAHYLGATTLDKWLKNKPLTVKELQQVQDLKNSALPRFMKIYSKVANKQVEA